jgi:hypothetical protein
MVVDEKTRMRTVVDEKTRTGTGTGRRGGEWTNSAGEFGDMQPTWREIDMIWLCCRRIRGSTRRFAPNAFVRSPRARPGGPGTAWARRIYEGPNPDENKEPGAQLDRFTPSG